MPLLPSGCSVVCIVGVRRREIGVRALDGRLVAATDEPVPTMAGTDDPDVPTELSSAAAGAGAGRTGLDATGLGETAFAGGGAGRGSPTRYARMVFAPTDT